MKTYGLYVNEPQPDKYGHETEHYVYIKDIKATVNFISITKITDDIRYKDCEYMGLTEDKDFDVSKNYMLISDSGCFIAKSINVLTRFTQMYLQAVI
jgi:hypothetical protein